MTKVNSQIEAKQTSDAALEEKMKQNRSNDVMTVAFLIVRTVILVKEADKTTARDIADIKCKTICREIQCGKCYGWLHTN